MSLERVVTIPVRLAYESPPKAGRRLFSPSLKHLMSAVSCTLGEVISVDIPSRSGSVRFRNEILTVALLTTKNRVGANWAPGDEGIIIESPRGTFNLTNESLSWYSIPLSNWLVRGKKASVALEYFLRRCRKVLPEARLIDDVSPSLDVHDPIGIVDLAEWVADGRDIEVFRLADHNADGMAIFDGSSLVDNTGASHGISPTLYGIYDRLVALGVPLTFKPTGDPDNPGTPHYDY